MSRQAASSKRFLWWLQEAKRNKQRKLKCYVSGRSLAFPLATNPRQRPGPGSCPPLPTSAGSVRTARRPAARPCRPLPSRTAPGRPSKLLHRFVYGSAKVTNPHGELDRIPEGHQCLQRAKHPEGLDGFWALSETQNCFSSGAPGDMVRILHWRAPYGVCIGGVMTQASYRTSLQRSLDSLRIPGGVILCAPGDLGVSHSTALSQTASCFLQTTLFTKKNNTKNMKPNPKGQKHISFPPPPPPRPKEKTRKEGLLHSKASALPQPLGSQPRTCRERLAGELMPKADRSLEPPMVWLEPCYGCHKLFVFFFGGPIGAKRNRTKATCQE